MSGRVAFAGKYLGETVKVTFDFTSMLASGETISTQVVVATVYSGTDATPSNIISGSASASGAVVTQAITGGTLGVTYELKCTITTSASQTLILTGYFPIPPELT